MPTNLHGPGDNYHCENGQAVSALIRRCHEAKQECLESVTILDVRKARRELLYGDDMTLACTHVMMLHPSAYAKCTRRTVSHIDVRTGMDVSISDLASTVSEIAGYCGGVETNIEKLDDAPQKLLKMGRIPFLGWPVKVSLRADSALACADFVEVVTEEITLLNHSTSPNKYLFAPDHTRKFINSAHPPP